LFNATCGRSCDLRDHHRFKTEWSYENLLTGSPILAVDRFGTQIGGKGLPFIEASIAKAKAEFQEQKIVNTIAKKIACCPGCRLGGLFGWSIAAYDIS